MAEVLRREDLHPDCAFVTLSIIIDQDGCVSWKICNNKVFQVLQPGYRLPEERRTLDLGGYPNHVRTKNFLVGFGNTSYLDNAIVTSHGHKYSKTYSHLVRQLPICHYYTEGYKKTGEQGKAEDIQGFFAFDDCDSKSGYWGQGAELKLEWIKVKEYFGPVKHKEEKKKHHC
jgi:hypothetical protein